jgi:cholesterol transport system auxiliary component
MGIGGKIMVRNTAKFLTPISLALALSSCVNLGGKAPPSLLVITAQQSVAGGTVKSGAAKDALVVLIPEVPRKLETTRVPVQMDNSNIAYLTNGVWADRPARLMQMLVMETVAAKNGRLVLNEVDAGGKAGDFLSGSLLEFGLDASRNQAVVVYDAVRLQNGMPIDKRRFEARESVSEIKAGAAGAALNKAANSVAIEVAAWLATKP